MELKLSNQSSARTPVKPSSQESITGVGFRIVELQHRNKLQSVATHQQVRELLLFQKKQ